MYTVYVSPGHRKLFHAWLKNTTLNLRILSKFTHLIEKPIWNLLLMMFRFSVF